MVKFRELVNWHILNDDEFVGFFGDSEYFSENGGLKMGYWSFLDIIEPENIRVKENFTLDDKIDDSELLNPTPWLVENDNGKLCVVQIMYHDHGDN